MLFNCRIMRRPIGSENLIMQKRAKLSTVLSLFLHLLASFSHSYRARNNTSPFKYFLLPSIYCEIYSYVDFPTSFFIVSFYHCKTVFMSIMADSGFIGSNYLKSKISFKNLLMNLKNLELFHLSHFNI